MEAIRTVLRTSADSVNNFFGDREAWEIFLFACGSTAIALKLRDFLNHDESLKVRLKKMAYNIAYHIPSVRRQIDEEMGKAREEIEKTFAAGEGLPYITRLPPKGFSIDDVLGKLQAYQKQCDDDVWQKGYVSGCVYSLDENLRDLGAEVYRMFSVANPLHPDVFPDLRQIEAEVIRMCCTMFHGDANSCGTTTSGGTESLLLACLAYRNLAYSKGITHPEIVASINIHAAFDKAASLFRIRLIKVPLDPKTMAVDVAKMKSAITRNTCMLACNAPDYPYGQMDPITEIAELGTRYNIPVHVDACLGGFLIVFMEKAGYAIDQFDFRVPGVTSISCDTHKYGFAAKGTSVILYKDASYRKHQYSCAPEWRGGIYATATLAGSRGGGVIAVCWSTLMFMGEKSYVDATKAIISTARYIRERLGSINEIEVIGDPKVSVIAVTSKTISMFQLSSEMGKKGWHLTTLQKPAGMHIMVTLCHTQAGVADRLIEDFRNCIHYIKQNPDTPCEDKAKIYGMAQEVPDASIVSDLASMYLDAVYSTN